MTIYQTLCIINPMAITEIARQDLATLVAVDASTYRTPENDLAVWGFTGALLTAIKDPDTLGIVLWKKFPDQEKASFDLGFHPLTKEIHTEKTIAFLKDFLNSISTGEIIGIDEEEGYYRLLTERTVFKNLVIHRAISLNGEPTGSEENLEDYLSISLVKI